MTIVNAYHLKIDETNSRKKKFLCGLSNTSLTKWNTLKYLTWHISPSLWCKDCLTESEFVCIQCTHWNIAHVGLCTVGNCNCDFMKPKRKKSGKRLIFD